MQRLQHILMLLGHDEVLHLPSLAYLHDLLIVKPAVAAHPQTERIPHATTVGDFLARFAGKRENRKERDEKRAKVALSELREGIAEAQQSVRVAGPGASQGGHHGL